MSRITRRRFLKRAAASTAFAAFTVAGTKSSGQVIGAGDKIRVAVCGIHGQGQGHIRNFASMKDVDVTYLVDPDSSLFDSRARIAKELGGTLPQCVQDVRRALDDENVDAVSIATCNHWHSLIGVWACQAGKDVYVEKPLSHNVWEGRKLVEAAEKHGRVVQHGTQNRSKPEYAREIAAVQSGDYGKLLVAKGYCCKPRWSIGMQKAEPPPQALDWNLWLGPAPQQDFHRNLVHYNWHWFWDTGCGDTGNQGVHELDVARWAIKEATLPTEVWSLGGRFGYKDQGQTPNCQLSVYKFGDVSLVFETRGLVGKHAGFGNKVYNEHYTSEGMIRRGMFHPHGGGQAEPLQVPTPPRVAPGGPFGSFIAAVRSRKPEDCNCNAEVGHYSSALCHLANISYRLGQPVAFDKRHKALGDNPQVVESFEQIQANCKAVGMKLDESTYRLGRVLKLDPQSETFVGDNEANAMLRREYRRPFVVPDDVG